MSNQSRINRLSETHTPQTREGTAVVMIGSFAPIHSGHFDAAFSACAALEEREIPVESLVFTPNSAKYVQRKLPDEHEVWTYEHRIQRIVDEAPHPRIATYVDDVSGTADRKELILNGRVPVTIRRHLGFRANQLYLVVGSDQLLSVEAHLKDEINKAVCVLRPGSLDEIDENLRMPWVADAVETNRIVVTRHQDMVNAISSSAIRRAAALS